MLSNESRMWLGVASWSIVVATAVGASALAGARLSTSLVLLFVCVVPMFVALLVGFGAPTLTVAELLHTVNEQKDGR